MITLIDALKEMDKKDERGNFIPFDISFFTYNRTTKKGGQKIKLKQATKSGLKCSLKEKKMIGIDPRNGSHIISAHIRLITKFNNKKVIL